MRRTRLEAQAKADADAEKVGLVALPVLPVMSLNGDSENIAGYVPQRQRLDSKPSRWKLPPTCSLWLSRAAHDAMLARDWDTRALRVLERGDSARALDLATRGQECWVGALIAMLRGLSG